jgi:hypothetical protein
MKKTILILCTAAAAGLLAQSAPAAITFFTNQSVYSAAPGGSVNVTLELTTTGTPPNNIGGFDTIFEGAATQHATNISGDFTITSAVSNITGWSLIGFTPDSLTTGSSNHSGFVQNSSDMGFGENSTSQTQSAPATNLSLATYTFSIAPGTPAGIYTFDTTAGSTGVPPGDPRGSRVTDQSGQPFATTTSASFQITVVPEPETLSLFGLGTLGSFGLTVLRARRKA